MLFKKKKDEKKKKENANSQRERKYYLQNQRPSEILLEIKQDNVLLTSAASLSLLL